uniref:RGS domain-containing protein n=1 Tax=Heterorhabditis bacteriophora TaxID=37862 RepID=A0A1I7XD03_HETBA
MGQNHSVGTEKKAASSTTDNLDKINVSYFNRMFLYIVLHMFIVRFLLLVGQKYFAEFLKGEYSDENILFWQACEELKREKNAEKIEEKASFF